MNRVDLSKFDNSWYRLHRSRALRLLWYLVNVLVLQNPLNPSSGLKTLCLRLFGARVGRGVVLKPSLNVKYPWNLEIGDHSWIGERAWLDSLAPIRIGAHCCISQGAYLCTGNHDWTDPAFGLMVAPIVMEDGAWVGARAIVLPGVTVKTHAVVSAGSVLPGDAQPFRVYAGNPAREVRERMIQGPGPDEGPGLHARKDGK